MDRVLILAALLLPGCSFDLGGTRAFDGRGARDGAAADAALDLNLSADDIPDPDGVRADRSAPDRGRDQRPPDQRPPDQRPPDQRVQGTTCQANGYSFKASAVPVAGGTLTLEVTGTTQSWVLGGVATQAKQGPLDYTWTNKPKVSGSVTWTFSGVKVPASPGPYLLGFMVDAVNDNAAVGKLLAKCLP